MLKVSYLQFFLWKNINKDFLFEIFMKTMNIINNQVHASNLMS